MFKFRLYWILFFFELKVSIVKHTYINAYKLKTVQSCKHLKECSRMTTSPIRVIDDPQMPLPLNPVDKYNELVPFYAVGFTTL